MKYSWFILIFLVSSACMKGKKVDLIVHNAKIHCMDDQNTVEDAMAIKDGKIVEVGPERQILNKYRADEIQDAKQRDVFPGFTDAHTHMFSLAKQNLGVDLTDCKSMEEVVNRIKTYLKEKNSNIQIIGAQPTDNSKIPGIRKWSPEFLPKIFNPKKVDHVLEVSEEEARIMTKRLAKEEGIFAGMSSGGTVSAALKLAKTIQSGVLVAIICDRGDRYLSSNLFE